jgi:hydroxymethylpyrimidine kinase/phosphomethylpyrimidine kinase
MLLGGVDVGMLASEEIILVVADVLARTSIPSVVDPVSYPLARLMKVMVSTSGSTLLPSSATKAYITALLPHTTILTPNLPEALLLAKLAGEDFGTIENMALDTRVRLAFFLASKGSWILLKGGHKPIDKNGKPKVIDILVNKHEYHEFVSDFSSSENTHGTGCTLSCIS